MQGKKEKKTNSYNCQTNVKIVRELYGGRKAENGPRICTR